jgi:hypothetical protein
MCGRDRMKYSKELHDKWRNRTGKGMMLSRAGITYAMSEPEIDALLDEIDRLQNENTLLTAELNDYNRLLEQTRWIPVSERLPDNDGEYLTYGIWGEMIVGEYIAFSIPDWGVQEVTHWMPLPELPEADDD